MQGNLSAKSFDKRRSSIEADIHSQGHSSTTPPKDCGHVILNCGIKTLVSMKPKCERRASSKATNEACIYWASCGSMRHSATGFVGGDLQSVRPIHLSPSNRFESFQIGF